MRVRIPRVYAEFPTAGVTNTFLISSYTRVSSSPAREAHGKTRRPYTAHIGTLNTAEPLASIFGDDTRQHRITHVLTLELELLLDVKTKAVALAPAQVRGRRPLVASV